MQVLFLKEMVVNVRDKLFLIVMEYHTAIHQCMVEHDFESLVFSFLVKNSFPFSEKHTPADEFLHLQEYAT